MPNMRRFYQALYRTDYFIIIIKTCGMICVPLVYTLDLNELSLYQSSFRVLFTNWYPLDGLTTGLPFYYINSLGRPKEENNIWFEQKPCKCLVAWDCVKCFNLFVRFMCVCTFLFWITFLLFRRMHLICIHNIVSPM